MARADLTWIQALCTACWVREEGSRVPKRVPLESAQVCCECGAVTRAGIWVRRSPLSVAYPRVRL